MKMNALAHSRMDLPGNMEKKYQVFISSTYQDLKDERQAVSKAILDLGHIPSGMELFPAANASQLDYIKKVIDDCDYYVVIVGGRYGSLGSDGISFTEGDYILEKARWNRYKIADRPVSKLRMRWWKRVEWRSRLLLTGEPWVTRIAERQFAQLWKLRSEFIFE